MQNTANLQTHSLFGWALRSHRVGMLVTGLALMFGVVVTALSYQEAAKALGESVAAMGAQAEGVAKSVTFLTGPVQALGTIGGYLSYKVFGSFLVLVSVYAAVQGAQIIRGSEGKGLYDLWFSAGRTRTDLLKDRTGAAVTSLLVIVLCIYVGTVLAGAATKNDFIGVAIGQCCAVACVVLFSFALSFCLSQFFVSARLGAGITSGYIVIAYFIGNVSSSLGPLSFLRFFSVTNYYLQERTLVPGNTVNVGAFIVLLLAIAVVGILGAWAYLARDCDGVVFTRVSTTALTTAPFIPSRFWRRTLSLSWIAEQPIPLVAWFIGIGGFTALEASILPSVQKLLESDKTTRAIFQTVGAANIQAQFISAIVIVASYFVAGFIVSEVGRWVSDLTQHRLDVVFTEPISIVRFVLERAALLIMCGIWASFAVVAGLWLGATAGGDHLNLGDSLRVGIDLVLLSFAVGGVGMVLTAIFRSGLAVGVTGGLLILCFFWEIITSLFSWPSWTSNPSVFIAFDKPYVDALNAGDVIYLLALGLIGLVGTGLWMTFCKKVAD